MTFKSLAAVEGATPEGLWSGKGMRTLKYKKGNKSFVLVSVTNVGDQEQYTRLWDNTLAPGSTENKVLYFRPFDPNDEEWFEKLFNLVMRPISARMRRLGIVHRIDAIPEGDLPKNVVPIDFIDHLRKDRKAYRKLVLAATWRLWRYALYPKSETNRTAFAYLERGVYTPEDEVIREPVDEFVIDHLKKHAEDEGEIILVAPIGLIDNAGRVLEKHGYEREVQEAA